MPTLQGNGAEILIVVPGLDIEQITDGVLHGELEIFEFFFPVRPFIAIEEGDFPNAITRTNHLGVYERSHLTLKLTHWVSNRLVHDVLKKFGLWNYCFQITFCTSKSRQLICGFCSWTSRCRLVFWLIMVAQSIEIITNKLAFE
jgi:hypothetical protein